MPTTNPELEISVYVSNVATYEGGWIDLPVEKEELDAFLRSTVNVEPDGNRAAELAAQGQRVHESYEITDMEYDRGAEAIGFEGANIHSMSLNSLNLLAAAVQYADQRGRLEAVKPFMDVQSPRDQTPLAYANALLDSDEIAFFHYDEYDDVEGRSAQLEAFGRAMFPDVTVDNLTAALDPEEISSYFDFEAYGTALESGEFTAKEHGYLDLCPGSGIDIPSHDDLRADDEMLSAFEEQGVSFDPSPDAEELKEMLGNLEGSIGYRIDQKKESLSEAAPYISALNAWVDSADAFQVESVEAYMSEQGNRASSLQFAFAALNADELPFHPYELDHGEAFYQSDQEKLGETICNEFGYPDDFVDYFDYEAYGESMSDNYELSEKGFLYLGDRGPDLGFYDADDIAEMCGGALRMDLGAADKPKPRDLGLATKPVPGRSFVDKAERAKTCAAEHDADKSMADDRSERSLANEER